MGTLIDRFEEHDGPVRSVAFHPTQNIFVSGGDDYKIRLWSLQSRKSIAVLSGISNNGPNTLKASLLTFDRAS
jgi:coatomer protein complex subunit alpha (xenin)